MLSTLVAFFPSTAGADARRFGPLLLPGGLSVGPFNEEQGLLVLAILAGSIGSYIHAAQSFAAYVGNRQFIASWVWWYLLRAPIGAMLGLLVYVLTRTGLVGGNAQAVSPYGVVAFAGMAGWFSKQATDKLAEVFDTLFRSAKAQEYKDKLEMRQPLQRQSVRILEVKPSVIPESPQEVFLSIVGTGFVSGATALLDGQAVETRFVDANTLEAKIEGRSRAPGTEAALSVKNPGTERPSPAVTIKFAH
jgi:hypothetical protein